MQIFIDILNDFFILFILNSINVIVVLITNVVLLHRRTLLIYQQNWFVY